MVFEINYYILLHCFTACVRAKIAVNMTNLLPYQLLYCLRSEKFHSCPLEAANVEKSHLLPNYQLSCFIIYVREKVKFLAPELRIKNKLITEK